jgi:putative spermidine/putrescine transport system permease protein
MRIGIIVIAVLLYGVGLLAPLAVMLVTSIRHFSTLGPAPAGITLENFVEVVTDASYRSAFATTIAMSLGVVVIAAACAYPLCLYMRRAPTRVRNVLLVIVIAPLLVSVVVRTLGWQLLLGPAGVVDRALGVTLLYTNAAVLLGLVHLFLAHMVLALLSVLGGINEDVLNAARTLGTSEGRIFRKIIFPLSLPGLLAGSVVTFGASTGALITPLFLGGARVDLVSVEIYRSALVLFNWPLASAIAVALLVVNYGVVQGAEKLLKGRMAWAVSAS